RERNSGRATEQSGIVGPRAGLALVGFPGAKAGDPGSRLAAFERAREPETREVREPLLAACLVKTIEHVPDPRRAVTQGRVMNAAGGRISRAGARGERDRFFAPRAFVRRAAREVQRAGDPKIAVAPGESRRRGGRARARRI